MAFVTFAALLAGLVAGFLPGLAVGWHASPTLVRLVENEDELEAHDNEIVTPPAVRLRTVTEVVHSTRRGHR